MALEQRNQTTELYGVWLQLLSIPGSAVNFDLTML